MTSILVTRSIIVQATDQVHDEYAITLPPNHDPRWLTKTEIMPFSVGDHVVISVPCSGEDHEGNYHELSAGRTGTIDRIDVWDLPQGVSFTINIPVDADHNIVNVFDEGDGPIGQFLTAIPRP